MYMTDTFEFRGPKMRGIFCLRATSWNKDIFLYYMLYGYNDAIC